MSDGAVKDVSWIGRSGCLVIGFSGPMGVGKSTAAALVAHRVREVVTSRWSGEFVAVADKVAAQAAREAAPPVLATSFAAPVRRMLTAAFGVGFAALDKAKPASLLLGKSPRECMRTLGTGWGREMIDPDLWVALWVRAAEDHARAGAAKVTTSTPHLTSIITVDDVRHANEADAIRAVGGVVVTLGRPSVADVRDHSSEARDFESDFTVDSEESRLGYDKGQFLADSVSEAAQVLLADSIIRTAWLVMLRNRWRSMAQDKYSRWDEFNAKADSVDPRRVTLTLRQPIAHGGAA